MEQKKTILFFAKLFHPHIGGVEKHIVKISKVLLDKGFRIIIITEKYEEELLEFEKFQNIEIYRISVPKNIFFKKFYIWQWIFLNLNLLQSADIIHIHDVFYWILPFRLFLPFKRVFITFHGYEGFPLKKRWIIMRVIAERLTNGNIVVGNFMKKWYKTKPNFVIYGATDELRKVKVSPNFHSAIFFGRLDSQTGILEYVKAYKILKQKYPKFVFTVVGEGEYVNKLPKEIKVLKFSKSVSQFIRKSRFIFVSRYLSMLEGMSLKRTVIATYDNDIKKDYLLDSPFKNHVVVSSNAEEIVSKVDFFIKNPKKEKQMVEKAYEFSKEQSWEKVVEVYLRLWKKE